jgi:hypothetical protein
MNHVWSTALAVSLLCVAGTVAAQSRSETTDGVAACAAIESAVARLDCFDELATRAGADDGADPAPRTAPQEAADSGNGAPESSGAANAPPADETNRVSRREARAADRAERELTGRVAAVREIQPGRIEVTLANGQVWRQTNSDRYNLLVGHEVRLYPTGFGQYFRLSAKELRSFIQVERVR